MFIILGIILVLIIILGITAFVLYRMATNTENESKFNTTASTDILKPMINSVITGAEQEITDEQLNGFIAHTISSQEINAEKESNIKIKNIAVYLHEGTSNDIYIEMFYHETKIILSAKADIALHTDKENISFTLQETKLGTLPISTAWVMKQLKSSDAFLHVSSLIQIEDNTILVPTSYSTSYLGVNLSIDIIKLLPKEGTASIQTTSTASRIKDFLSELF